MPPRGDQSKERTRQAEHVKENAAQRGHRPTVAKRNATAATNKTRRMKGK